MNLTEPLATRYSWGVGVTYCSYPFWWQRSQDMPRVEDILLDCVFYIFASEQDAIENNDEMAASGFFFVVQSEENENRFYSYAITNSHVIFHSEMRSPTIRINTTGGNYELIVTEKEDWIRHPFGDDLAMHPIQIDYEKHEFGWFTKHHIITDEFLEEYNVGPGDDVFMVGRFRAHSGRKKNLPTVRFGNIAMMPEEPIYNPTLDLNMDSFLVEMRSISGFSGSPVVIDIPPMSNRKHKYEGNVNKLSLGSATRLLGIDWGHIPIWEKAKDSSGNNLKVKMNSAMAGVVPSWKLLDLVFSDEMIEKRRKDDEVLKQEIENADFVTD